MDTTQITDTSTHDHMATMDDWRNGHGDDEQYPFPADVVDDQMPMRCEDCGRPAYYDTETDEYHHAVAPEIPCFLIGPSDRDADPTHPLVGATVWTADQRGWWTASI